MTRSSADNTDLALRDDGHRVDPMLVATLCAIASAILYTLTNIFLRRVAETCDPAWVSAVKALPISLGSLAFVMLRARRRQSLGLRRASFFKLLVISVFVQFGGNLPFQWSLGQLGLAIVVPITTAVIVASGAMLGLWWLGERVTLRGIAAMVLLVVAVTVLSTTARQANTAVHGAAAVGASSWLLAALGVTAACVAGLAYSATTAALRRALVRGVALPVGLAVISTTGVIGLSAFTLANHGWSVVVETAPSEWCDMVAAGVFNALAFVTLGVSLHRITVTQSNVIGASQTAMAAIAGVVFFGEPVSAALVAGVALTVVSMMIIERRGAPPTATVASESAEAG